MLALINHKWNISSLGLIYPIFHYAHSVLTVQIGTFTQSKYLCSVPALIQLMWTHFLYLSILTLVSISFPQSNGDKFVQSITSTGTDLALWLCKLIKTRDNMKGNVMAWANSSRKMGRINALFN